MTDALTVALAILLALAGFGWARAWRAGSRAQADRAEAQERGRSASLRAELAEQAARQAEAGLAEARSRCDGFEARHGEAQEEGRRLHSQSAELRRELRGLHERFDEARQERGVIQGRLDDALSEIRRLEKLNEGLVARLEARQKAHEDEVALLREMRAEMTSQFRLLSGDVLKDQGTRFGQANRDQVEALLKPVRQEVEGFRSELRAVHADADAERKLLKGEIERLSRSSQAISEEATALARALRGDKQRQGAWGEMLLERILEESGLREGLHYERQAAARDDEGARLRPDVVVRLPGDRRLVIDSKVSLNAYTDAANAETEEAAAPHLAAHVAAVRAHVDGLSRKDYAAAVGGSVDYVMMFMPVESALGAAWRQGDDLAAHAIGKRIAIVTPTTLLTVLRTVQHVWAVEDRNRNAEAIADRAGRLYDKVHGFVDDMTKVGERLDQARASYDGAMSKLSQGKGNVLRQVEQLRSMGARTNKSIAVPSDGDDAPPAIEAAE